MGFTRPVPTSTSTRAAALRRPAEPTCATGAEAELTRRRVIDHGIVFSASCRAC